MSALSLGFFVPEWPPSAAPSGIITYAATVVPVLRELGHHVSILAGRVTAPSSDGAVYDAHRAWAQRPVIRRATDAIHWKVAPRSAVLAFTQRLIVETAARMVQTEHLDLLEMEEAFGAAAWVRREVHVPVCVRLHGPWFLVGPACGAADGPEFRQRVVAEGRGIARVDGITAPARHVLERVRARYSLPLQNARVIPNPTAPVPEARRWRAGHCAPREILFVGRFDRLKGGDLLIDAFRLVLERAPDARLRIVGPDHGFVDAAGRTYSLQQYARERAPSAFEKGQIEWLGPLPSSELDDLRRRAYCVVVPSRFETFSLAVAEAMAAGCPIVAARVGGIPELLGDRETGLLHAPGDAVDLARRILELFDDPRAAACMGRLAGIEAERRLHPDVVAASLTEFYGTLARPR
jgi:glycosyltransferase involved in cell wall biosynthesis